MPSVAGTSEKLPWKLIKAAAKQCYGKAFGGIRSILIIINNHNNVD